MRSTNNSHDLANENRQSAYHVGRVPTGDDVEATIRDAVRRYMTEDLGLAESLAIDRAHRELRREIPTAVLNTLAEAGINVADRDVLDLGAGLGGMSEALVLAGARVTAIEPGAAWAEVATRRATRHAGHFQLFTAVGEAMPFSDESFDLIVSLQVLEHTTDPGRVLAEAWRVLRPGGHFFLACENYLAFREGHYQVAWFPLLPKWLGGLYLRLRGRSPRFLNEAVTYTTYPGVIRDCRRLGFVQLRDEEFIPRLRRKGGLKGGIVRTVDWLTSGRAPLVVDFVRNAFKFGIAELFRKPPRPLDR